MPWTKTKKLLVGLPVVVAGAVLLMWFAGRAYCYRALDRSTAAFRERGFPTRIAEIVPVVGLEADNAAPFLERATAIFKDLDATSSGSNELYTLIDYGNEKMAADGAEAVAVLRRFEREPFHELVDLASAAASRTLNAPNRDYAIGPALEIPEVSTTRTLSQLIATRVRLRLALGGSSDEIWSDISIQFGLAELASQPPTLIDSLTGIACRRLTFGSIEATAEAGQIGRNHDSLVAALVLSDAQWSNRMLNALHGERLVFLDWMATHFLEHDNWLNEIAALAATRETSSKRRVPRFVGSMVRPVAALDLSHAYRYHFEIVDAVASLPPHEVHAAVANAEKTIASSKWPLTAIASPMLSKVIKTHFAAWSEQRAWTVALASASMRATTGKWPTSIVALDLPPGFAIDPCSGHEMHFVPSEDGLLVYADGPDATDDGGRDWQSGAERSVEDGDIVVELKLSR